MKKLFKVALVAICMLSMGNFAKAQGKIGYVNFEQVVQLMPELKTIQTQMQAYSKTYSDQLQGLQTEFQTKATAFQAKQATMTDAARTAAQAELGDLQKRAQDYNTSAQTAVDAKSQELLKPLTDKVHAAISAVAKEKGYAYVFNSSSPDLFLVSPEGDDLLAAVKLKLGLK
jgi:outer membrane protein